MKTILLCTLLLMVLCRPGMSQEAKDSIVYAVTDYVDAFYYGDTTKIHRSIDQQVYKYGYFRDKNANRYEGMSMSFQEMIDYSKAIKKRGPAPNIDKAPKQIVVFDLQDQTASAKLTAWWGTDYILLTKMKGKWKITHVLWQSPSKK